MECNAYREAMLDVLYGEGDAAARRRFEQHQADCAACRDELAGLRRLRGELAAWTLPPSLRPRRSRSARPWRPLAVAAGIVVALGAALGLAGSELRYDQGRVAFRLGRAGAPPAEALEQRLASLEARHREEIRALREELQRARLDGEAALYARVSDLVRRSEARQAVLVGTSLASLRDETEAKRRYDLAQVGASFSYLEGKTGLQAARTTELMGHVLQAAQKR